MAYHYIWMSNQPHLAGFLRRANEERSAAIYATFRGIGRGIRLVGAAVTGFLARQARKQRERAAIRDLEALDDRLLKDIGVARGEIRRVAHDLAQGVEEPRTLAARLNAPARPARPDWLRGVVEGDGRGTSGAETVAHDTSHKRAACG